MLPSDLYFSTKLTKFDAVKGTNGTYNHPEESVKFWWVSDNAKWPRFVLKVKLPKNYENAKKIPKT